MSSDIPHLDQLTYDYVTGKLSKDDYRRDYLDAAGVFGVEDRDTYQFPGFDESFWGLSDQNAPVDPLTGLAHSRENRSYIDRAHALEGALGTATYADTGQSYSSGQFLPPVEVVNEARRKYENSLLPAPILSRGRLDEALAAAQAYANLPAPVTQRQASTYSAAPAAAPGLFSDLAPSPFADSYDAFGIPIEASPVPADGLLSPRTTTVGSSVPGPESIWSGPAVWGLDEFPVIPQELVIDPNEADTGDQAVLPGMDEQLSPGSFALASLIFGAAGLGLPFTVARGYNFLSGDNVDPVDLAGFNIDPMEFGGIGGFADADDTADAVDTIGAFDEDMGEGFDPGEF